MSKGKKAAIDLDEIKDKKLDEISASEFLSALKEGGASLDHLTVWPEKKKVELYVEPENWGNFHVDDILDVIKNEKKKTELEKNPMESWRDPRRTPDPRNMTYDQLLNRLATDLEERFRK